MLIRPHAALLDAGGLDVRGTSSSMNVCRSHGRGDGLESTGPRMLPGPHGTDPTPPPALAGIRGRPDDDGRLRNGSCIRWPGPTALEKRH
jgi:hypothetical protein